VAVKAVKAYSPGLHSFAGLVDIRHEYTFRSEQHMRILVIESEQKLARSIKKAIQAERFALDMVSNGEAALEFAEATHYDVIILDLPLPDFDSVSLLKRIRRNGAAIMVLGGGASVSERIRAFEAGADDYLSKPFSYSELAVRIHVLLRRPRVVADKLRVADLEIDLMTREVSRQGKVIELTSKEYGVLEYLMRNTGRPVTRAMLIEHVWNHDFQGLTNVVDVYINYLRSKIDEGFQTKLIHTARGVGYALIDSTDNLSGRARLNQRNGAA
jgi:DNA-binding response OmpR family regulator